ncbi:hypothetical protein FSP39_024641 [Pinctada imbricata]|uniref:Anticodon-binding domain-containing protein n=1 Tax=Pinctada imbricata TaxID=66713 RepID=A0AA88YPK0_PINIB|nr:hypothetical protein FSP39_024641 [Pinctada imbricata]
MGKQFKQNAKTVADHLAKYSPEECTALEEQLKDKGETEIKIDDKSFTITADMVEIKKYQKTVHVQEIVPSVIEPSFGIGRVMYCIFEHNFKVREGDEKRTYLSLPPVIAPYKCSVLPLSSKPDFRDLVSDLSRNLTRCDISHKVDDSGGSIGRRYARTDAISIPFGVTIDFDSLKSPHTATLRERDTTKQIRAEIKEIPEIVRDLATGRRTWDDVLNNYPLFEQQEATK